MVNKKPFVFGVKELDQLLGDALKPGTLLVIGGYPGTGKTTLASTMAYHNACLGHKVLYISFQEDREKLFNNMKNLGIELQDLADKGMFKFVQLPVFTTDDTLSELISHISKLVGEERFEVIIIDSITPLLTPVDSSIKARGILQNFFYGILKVTKGLTILLSEIPLDVSGVEFGNIEFVADVMIILKHRIEEDLIVRELEIRKVRGLPLHVAKILFTITPGKGFRAYPPPMLSEIPAPDTNKKFVLPCDVLRRCVGDLYGGETLYVVYPSDARPLSLLKMLQGLIIYNNAKALIISYRHSPQTLRRLIRENTGIKLNFGDQLHAFNPSAYSLPELYGKELELIEEHKPDIVIFLGVDALPHREGKNFSLLRNQILYLKSLGILVVRAGSYTDQKTYLNNTILSDIIMRYDYVRTGQGYKEELYIWRSGKEPLIVSKDILTYCLRNELSKLLNESRLSE